MAALAVVKFNDLPNLSDISAVRVFGTGSGDPAMNGLKVYLAFVSPHDQRAFLLGDFLDYRVIAASPGRIDLEYDEDFMLADEPRRRTVRTIVSWTEKAQEPSPNPEFPSTVTMSPAKLRQGLAFAPGGRLPNAPPSVLLERLEPGCRRKAASGKLQS